MVTRDYLLELDKKKKSLEEEIATITEFLEQPGNPGVSGNLLDKDGFPRADIDIMSIRKARNRLVMIQNDHKNLMIQIEQKMIEFFENVNKEKSNNQAKGISSQQKKNVDKNEPIEISIEEERKSTQTELLLPFATITLVIENSPSHEAGLKSGDKIVKFGSVEYGKFNDPLIKISEIVRAQAGQEIELKVLRKSGDDEKNDYIDLKLIPHVWSGQGLLGCKLALEKI